jgi:transcriptional regulator of arginine metabolism
VKASRQAAILRLVREQAIPSQEALRQALAGEGFEVAQATLSRDLSELRIEKAGAGASARYVAPDAVPEPTDAGALLPALVAGVDGVGPLLVLRTVRGAAGAVAAVIDQAGWDEVLGAATGEDTVLVVTRGPRERERVAERIAGLRGGS